MSFLLHKMWNGVEMVLEDTGRKMRGEPDPIPHFPSIILHNHSTPFHTLFNNDVEVVLADNGRKLLDGIWFTPHFPSIIFINHFHTIPHLMQGHPESLQLDIQLLARNSQLVFIMTIWL